MKTLAKLLYVEADEEITDLVDRLRDLSLEDEVTFVVPERARSLQSAMSFRLLKRYADSYGKRVNVVTADPRLQAMSQETGFTAYPNLAAYDRGTGGSEPEPVDQTYAPAPISAPAAPAVTAASAAAAAPTIRTAAATPPGPTNSTAPPWPASLATPAPGREAQVMSAPPKKKTPSSPSLLSEGPPLRSYRPYLIGAGVLAVIVLLVGILYLPSATATLTVQGTPIKADFTLRGAPGTPTGAADQFVTQAIHAEESQTLPGTATQQKQIPAQVAAGTVRFTDSCFGLCGSIPIRAGTSVSTNTGQQYITQTGATVSASSRTADVAVKAARPGAAGNVDVGQITVIDDPHDDVLTVTNTSATTGGADVRTATVIQQSDIDTVRDGYLKDATTRVTDQINGKAGGLHVVLVGTGVQSTVTPDHKVGDEVQNGFGITVKVFADAVAFDEKAVKGMLKADLLHKIPQGTELTNSSTPTYDPIDTTADGHVTLNGHVSGFYSPIFLESAIRAHLKGMSPSNAHAFLQSLPNVLDARVVQQPFGLPWLPLFSSRISLQIQEVSGASSP